MTIEHDALSLALCRIYGVYDEWVLSLTLEDVAFEAYDL